MNKGDKVLCISADPGWRKVCKPSPKAGWVYLVKAVAAFDENGKPARVGSEIGIALEGIKSDQTENFFDATCFRLLRSRKPQPPKHQK